MEEMKKEYYNGNKQEFWKTDLDYRKTTVNPSIIYIVENYEQHDIAWEYLEIAPSFDVFLTMLYRKAIIDPKTLKVTYKKR